MSFGVVFLVSAAAFLLLVVWPKMRPHTRRDPTSDTASALEAEPKPVRGDELSIWPFATMPIMTDSEVLFFQKLSRALPDYHIFVQVQLSRIIEASSDDTAERRFWFNRICRQSVDYVVVADDLQTTVVAIELDDWTHDSKARQKADDKKDKALASAGIPIVRFHAERMPSVEVLRYELLEVIEHL